MRDTPSTRFLFRLGAIVLALLLTTLVLIAVKAPPPRGL